jgi:hypothetical protein
MKLTPPTKWIVAAIVLLAVVLFATNPDQAAHLKSVKDTLDLRFPKPAPGLYSQPVTIPYTSIIEYHNYGICSRTTVFDATISFGILGRVQTTDDVTYVVTGPPSSR